MPLLGYIAWNPRENDNVLLYILNIIRKEHNLKLSFMYHPNTANNTSMAVEISGIKLRIKGVKKSLKKIKTCINDMKSVLDLNLVSYTFDVLDLY
jgi:hypothetical protein